MFCITFKILYIYQIIVGSLRGTMARVKKPKYTMEELGSNNFSDKTMLQIPIREIIWRDIYIRDSSGLEKEYKYIAERLEYAKVFATADYRTRINKLTLRGKEMFLWLLYTVKMGEDSVWINRERYMEEMDISSNTTIVATIKDLVKHNIIAPTMQKKDVYWINPNFFFKGDRLKKYPDNHNLSEKQERNKQEARDLREASTIKSFNNGQI